jgi:hypothetical protein
VRREEEEEEEEMKSRQEPEGLWRMMQWVRVDSQVAEAALH